MYYCRRCNYTTIRYSNLRRHMSVHTKIYIGHIQCSLCNYKSSRKQNVTRHLIKKHNGKGEVVTETEPNEVPNPYLKTIFVANFQCNLCNFSSTKEKDVIQHQSTGHGGKGVVVESRMEVPKTHLDPSPDPLPDLNSEPHTIPDPQHKIVFAATFQCSACNYRSVKKENVIKHQTLKHGNEEQEEPAHKKVQNSENISEANFQCGMCNYSSHSKANVMRHQFAKHRDDDEVLAPVQTKKPNPDQNAEPVKELDEDESEPAKRLLLAECGLIWHSNKILKK